MEHEKAAISPEPAAENPAESAGNHVASPVFPTTRFCENCNKTIVPKAIAVAKQNKFLLLCPQCSRTVGGVKMEPDNSTVDQIERELRRDFRGTMLDVTFRKLATVEERARLLRPGSMESKRAAEHSRELVQTLLELQQMTPQTRDDDDLESLSHREIAKRLRAAAADADRLADAEEEAARPTPRAATTEPSNLATQSVEPPEPPAPAPRCEYCDDTLARCEERKVNVPSTWRTLHWDDPQEVERRSREWAAEMVESLRRNGEGTPQW
jgi:hypothetical protein